jgi:hypothetical protein
MFRKSTDVQEEVKADVAAPEAVATPEVTVEDILNEIHKVSHIVGDLHLRDAEDALGVVYGHILFGKHIKLNKDKILLCQDVNKTIKDAERTKEYSLSTLASIIANLKKIHLDTYADEVASVRAGVEAQEPGAHDNHNPNALFGEGGLGTLLARLLATQSIAGAPRVIIVTRGFGGFPGGLFGGERFYSPERRSPGVSPDASPDRDADIYGTPEGSPERSASPVRGFQKF